MTRLSIILSLWVFVGCDSGRQPPPAPPPPMVTVITPVEVPVQRTFDYNGTLEAVESVQIQARVEGFLEEVRFKEGDEVKKNDPLYLIDPREFQSAVSKARGDIARSNADIANAKAQILLAEADLKRLEQVGKEGASKSELDKAVATLAANKAQLDVAIANKSSAEAAERTAQLKLGYTDIKAPIAGRISRTLVTPGNLVGQKDATLLTSIVSLDPVFVYFDVPEKDLVSYQQLIAKPGQTPTKIPVFIGIGTEEGYPHQGELDFQDIRVETGSGTVRIRGKVPNPAEGPQKIRKLVPGNYVRVQVPIGSPQPKLAIPEDAILTGQEGRYVLVIGPENVVQKRTLVLGPTVWRSTNSGQPWTLTNLKPDGKALPNAPVRSVVAVESGLKAGERVVAVGTQKARPGLPVTPEDWQFRNPK